MTTVLNTTVKNGFCCGCGVCAGLCPKNAIRMEFNVYGEYNPILIDDCSDCGLCLKVCPFADGNPNEDELGKKIFSSVSNIQYQSETGYYLCAGVGFVSNLNHRMSSASGGLATWFLEELLRNNIVDAVVNVQWSNNKERIRGSNKELFCFTISTTPNEVRCGAGSAYYPVEISDILTYIYENSGRYAIIGLPCLLKGIRLAQEKNILLRERIVLLIGLSCHHLNSTKFTEYAIFKSGFQGDVASVSYRHKSLKIPAEFYRFTIVGKNGTIIEQEFPRDMFSHRFCSLRACECCDDLYAELSDVTFMDAWLPKYANEPRGTSMYIVRTPRAKTIIDAGMDAGDITVEPIAINDVVRSQGSLRWKRDKLAYRLTLMKKRGWNAPTKRVVPNMGKQLFMLERYECKKCLDMHDMSRERVLEGYNGVEKWFDNEMISLLLPIRIYRLIRRLIQMVFMIQR